MEEYLFKAYHRTGGVRGLKLFTRENLSSEYKNISGFFKSVEQSKRFGWTVIVIQCIN